METIIRQIIMGTIIRHNNGNHNKTNNNSNHNKTNNNGNHNKTNTYFINTLLVMYYIYSNHTLLIMNYICYHVMSRIMKAMYIN